MELNNIPEAFQTKLRVAVLSALVTGTKTGDSIPLRKSSGLPEPRTAISVCR